MPTLPQKELSVFIADLSFPWGFPLLFFFFAHANDGKRVQHQLVIALLARELSYSLAIREYWKDFAG